MRKPEERNNHLISAQNNSIRSNYIKAKFNNTPKNCKCRLCGDRDHISKTENWHKRNTRESQGNASCNWYAQKHL